MIKLLVCLVLCAGAATAQFCDTSNSVREGCGFIGIDQQQCTSAPYSCCWDTSFAPYCFNPTSASTTAGSSSVVSTSTSSPFSTSTSSAFSTSTGGSGSGSVTFGNNSWTTTFSFTGGVAFCSQCGDPGAYACSSSNVGGPLAVDNFLPSAKSLVSSITVSVQGSYGCSAATGTAEIIAVLNGLPISAIDLNPSSCPCNSCDGEITLPTVYFPSGLPWPSAAAILQLNIAGNSVCLNQASITVEYLPTVAYRSLGFAAEITGRTGTANVCGATGAKIIQSTTSFNTLFTFKDTLPPGAIAVGISLELLGQFFYDASSSTNSCRSPVTASFALGGNVFAKSSLASQPPQNNRVSVPACAHPVYINSGCNNPWIVSSNFYQNGVPGYVYNGTSSVTVAPANPYGALQIAYANVVIYYV